MRGSVVVALVVILGWGSDALARRAARCVSNDDCAALSYCDTPPGECGGFGTCRPRGINLFCIQTVDPVCGCDGKTYDNDCYAMKAGAALDHRGSCEEPPPDGGCDG